MNRSVDILNELNEISPLLAGISNKNVFSVPDGYFDTVADAVSSLLDAATEIADKNNMPPGYFENLAADVLSKIPGTVANELREIAPFLGAIKKETPYKVPANYFDELATTITGLTEDEQPDILTSAKHLQPFTVPQGYFESLSDSILSNVKSNKPAKLVPMPAQNRSLVKYAAAAAIIGAIAFGVYKAADHSPLVSGNGQLASIDSVITKGMSIAADAKKFDETLGNLDEEAISKYLEQNASETDMASLSSGIDEGTLPTQEDYLTDEKTLDNFIEEISSKN